MMMTTAISKMKSLGCSTMSLYYVLLFMWINIYREVQSTGVVLTGNGGGRVSIGSRVVLQCRAADTDSRRTSIVWYRRQADVVVQLGIEDLVVADLGTFRGAPRVRIVRRVVGNSVESNLTISDARVEDSGEILCGTSLSASTSMPLAVCASRDSSLCNCMMSHARQWPSWCFKEQYGNREQMTADRREVIALGATLGIVLVYVVIMSCVASKEWMRHRLHKRLTTKYGGHCAGVNVLGRPPYNDSDVLQLDGSDSSSDATTAATSSTATSSSTCSVTEYNPLFDGQTSHFVDQSPHTTRTSTCHVERHGRAETFQSEIRADIHVPSVRNAPTSRRLNANSQNQYGEQYNLGYQTDDNVRRFGRSMESVDRLPTYEDVVSHRSTSAGRLPPSPLAVISHGAYEIPVDARRAPVAAAFNSTQSLNLNDTVV